MLLHPPRQAVLPMLLLLGAQHLGGHGPVGPPSEGALHVLHHVLPRTELADREASRDHQQRAEPPRKRKVAGDEPMVARCHVVRC